MASRPALLVTDTLPTLLVACALFSPACHATTQEPSAAAVATNDPLEHIASIHGGAGPWVVAGYRMGRYALSKLGLPPQSFDLEVTHRTPEEVQYSCIADGAAAATGASIGKLNLRLVEATEETVATTYRRKSTGQSVVLRPTAAFAVRFRDTPRAQLAAAGRIVLSLPDDAIFEEIASPP